MTEKLDILFLGTGTSMPTKAKNHTGILLTWKNESILVDCGEGTQRQFRIADLSPTRITKILLTHWHADHALGLAGLLHTLHMSGYSKTLHLYGPKGTIERISLLERVFGKFKINLQVKEISHGKVYEDKELRIEAAEMSHGTPTLAYSIVVKSKMRINKNKLKKLKLPNSPLLGELQMGKDITHPKTKKRIRASSITYLEKGKKITIIMDTAMNNRAIALAKNSDILISEASFIESQRDKADAYKHMTAADAARMAKKANASKLVLTHNSQRYDGNVKPVIQEARKIFKNSQLVNDFDNFSI